MRNNNVEKVDNKSVFKIGTFITFLFSEGITVLNKDGIKIHYKEGSPYLICNSKVISSHNAAFDEYKKVFKNYKYTKLLMEYNVPYIVVKDGTIMQYTVVQSKNQDKKYNTFLLKEELNSVVESKIVNRIELEKFYKKRTDEDLFILNDNGGIYYGVNSAYCQNSNFIIPSENYVMLSTRNKYISAIDEERHQLLFQKSKKVDKRLQELYKLKRFFLDMNLDNIEYGINVYDNDILVVRINNNKSLSIQDSYIKVIGKDKFKLQVLNYILNEHVNNENINLNGYIPKNKILKRKI